ncbi:hypothetical protein ACIPSG_21645, partial [Pectobacterium sp. CHL-2024]|uniref:hypothetical protein n=1 Tax=Pectobacterium sp. CHL-2024 TaxID=3377079 RepID=UPI0037F9B1CA
KAGLETHYIVLILNNFKNKFYLFDHHIDPFMFNTTLFGTLYTADIREAISEIGRNRARYNIRRLEFC